MELTGAMHTIVAKRTDVLAQTMFYVLYKEGHKLEMIEPNKDIINNYQIVSFPAIIMPNDTVLYSQFMHHYISQSKIDTKGGFKW